MQHDFKPWMRGKQPDHSGLMEGYGKPVSIPSILPALHSMWADMSSVHMHCTCSSSSLLSALLSAGEIYTWYPASHPWFNSTKVHMDSLASRTTLCKAILESTVTRRSYHGHSAQLKLGPQGLSQNRNGLVHVGLSVRLVLRVGSGDTF